MAVQKKLRYNNEPLDLKFFVENTELVYDGKGNYSVIFHTYPEHEYKGSLHGSTFLGLNIWLEQDSENEFDLKHRIFNEMKSSNKKPKTLGFGVITDKKKLEHYILPSKVFYYIEKLYDLRDDIIEKLMKSIKYYQVLVLIWFIIAVLFISISLILIIYNYVL